MSWNTNNNQGPFEWRDHQEQSGYYLPTHQYVPAVGNSSTNDLGTRDSQRESYTPGFTSDPASWSNNVSPDYSFSGYSGGAWPTDQYLDTRLNGSNSGTPGSDTVGPGMNPYGGVAPPIPDVQRPGFQAWPPSGTQTPSHWQTTPWPNPAGRHGDYNDPINSVPPFQVAGSSVGIENWDRERFQTGHPPLVPTPNNPASRRSPVSVPATTSSAWSHGERWNPPDAATFRCMWVTRGRPCSAYIPGDRKYVTAHLRDEHGFTCDGLTIACGWAGCTAHIQRRNIPRHIVAFHLEVKVPCPDCGLALSRADAGRKHRLACPRHRTTGGTEAADED